MKKLKRCAALLGGAIACAQPALAQGVFGSNWGGTWQGFHAGAGASIGTITMELPKSQGIVQIEQMTPPNTPDIVIDIPGKRDDEVQAFQVHAGYSLQRGIFVLGIEGDVDVNSSVDFPKHGGMTSQLATPPITNLPQLYVGANYVGSLDVEGHLRGVFGVAVMDFILPYVSVGGAMGQSGSPGLEVAIRVTDASTPVRVAIYQNDAADTVFGLSYGAGVKVRLGQKVELHAEYVRDEFATIDLPALPGGFQGGFQTAGGVNVIAGLDHGTELDWSADWVNASLAWRF